MFNELVAEAGVRGSYLALWKIVIFLIIFGLWAWVGQWMDKDAPAARANRWFWNNIYLGTGALVMLLWMVLPAPFIVDLLMFLAVWLTVCITYVQHRNARVIREQRILTPEHIRYVLNREGKKKTVEARLVFVSAHKNDLPVPHRQDEEFGGYVAAEDLTHEFWSRRVRVAELIPTGENYQLRYVIDGVVGVVDGRNREETEQAISYLKAAAGMEVKERRRPQSGHFSTRSGARTAEWKIQTAGSTRGEQLRLERIEEVRTMNLESLGLNAAQLKQVEQLVAKPKGIVLVCGTKGSGLTTTLYSMVRRHDAFIQNLHALELEPLTELDNITQHLVERGGEKTAARQLQSVLRGDPDVVMVGFCDEAEMAQHGSRAAREGKKLYYGLSQPSTFHGLQAWLKLVNGNELVAETLLGLVSQRLIRKLCPECKLAYTPDAALLRRLNLQMSRITQFYRPGEIEYDKRGRPIVCEKCQGTGYYGRTGVFELLIITEELRELIRQNAPVNIMRAQSRKEKMLYLQEEALRNVIDGATSIQEVLRVTTDKAGKDAARPEQEQTE